MNFPKNKYQPVVNPDTSIVFFGELWDVGVRVVKWYEKGGYNGYSKKKSVIREEDRKSGKMKIVKIIKGKRYGGRLPRPGRKAKAIRQFMVHHTGGYLPGVCFETLHNQRKLSVQFIQADNGVIYQTVDAKEISWHGGKQNRPSIGVECCLYPKAWSNPDAYREGKCKRLGLTQHEIGHCHTQGKTREVFMMPAEQVECLAFLIAGTWFSRDKICGYDTIAPRFPRKHGKLDTDFDINHRKHEGIVLHANVSLKKWDATGVDIEHLERRVSVIYNALSSGTKPIPNHEEGKVTL